jgi:6-pyruvoyl-tetrahydropterin synthase
MIIDFGELKEKITPVIDLYDHVLILNEEDPLLEVLGDQELSMWSMLGEPTAENFASRIARQVQEVLGDRAMVQSVTFYETPNNCATWTP